MKKINGVEIGKIKKNILIQNLYKKEYHYSIIRLSKIKKYETNILNIGSIAVIHSGKKNAQIKINGKEFEISKFKFFTFNLQKLEILGNSNILIGLAGIKKRVKKNYIKKFKETNIYKVIKPWGYELWINGQTSTYSFKKIFIKKGNRTSLQFHKKKIETNFLYNGSAELTLSKKNGKYKKDQIINNIHKKRLKSGAFLNVSNYAVHRLKAITDILLYEVSTPHLDDVIRLADDKKRKDGRILREHS